MNPHTFYGQILRKGSASVCCNKTIIERKIIRIDGTFAWVDYCTRCEKLCSDLDVVLDEAEEEAAEDEKNAK